MAILRDLPYPQFNFLVDLGDGDPGSIQAGFQEVSGIGTEIVVTEYRNGNAKENSVRKLTGLHKVSDVTLKRGIIGALNLYQWLDQVRNGDASALRTVTIKLLNEDRTDVALTWKLLRARIVKHTSGRSTRRAATSQSKKWCSRTSGSKSSNFGLSAQRCEIF